MALKRWTLKAEPLYVDESSCIKMADAYQKAWDESPTYYWTRSGAERAAEFFVAGVFARYITLTPAKRKR